MKSPQTTISEEFIQRAILNPLQDEKCVDLHPGIDCNTKMFYQFLATSQNAYKIYLIVHLSHLFIFRRKELQQKPKHEIYQFVKGMVKSLLFAAGHMTLTKRIVCFLAQHYKNNSYNASIGVFLGGMTVNFQPQGRQAEIALYVVNKSLQTLYHMALRRNYPVYVPYGESILLGAAVALIMYFYEDCPKAFRRTYLQILNMVIGNI